MDQLTKKQRLTPSCNDHSMSSTPAGKSLSNLLDWLLHNGAKGLDIGRFCFKGSDDECGGSLGGFAAREYLIGEVLFSIPLSCILSLSNTNDSQITELIREAAKALGDTKLVTSELLIWLTMIQGQTDNRSFFHPFLRSLDQQSPSPLSWPKDLAATLEGTNMSTMTTSFSSIEKHAHFLTEARSWALKAGKDCSCICAESFNLESLIWARGHYLARRYPGSFNSAASYEKSLGENEGDTDGHLLLSEDGRERGMMNLGALVPLLDILNHNPDREWLKFEVKTGYLSVICNYDIKEGSEIFSNYGSLSNEMLLFAYGFCLENNEDDAMTLQLMGVDSSAGTASNTTADPASSDAKHIGTYYIRAGGMEGIPNELWRQLTTLIGATDDDCDGDSDEDGDRAVGRRVDVDEDIREKGKNVNQDNQKRDINTATKAEELSLERVPSSSDRPDNLEHSAQGADEGAEDVDDEDDEAIEIGLEECAMLRDCLQRKLDTLISSQDRANKILESYEDPRSSYVQWYRTGQMRIASEAVNALNEILNNCDSGDDGNDQ